jgi:hypothetical protein
MCMRKSRSLLGNSKLHSFMYPAALEGLDFEAASWNA